MSAVHRVGCPGHRIPAGGARAYHSGRAVTLGVTIESLFTEVEGEIDVRGMPGVEDAPPSGYEHIRVVIDVAADCPDAALDDMLEFARTHAPVCGALENPVAVRIERAQS
ncbi:MAG: OsmC family protein [Halofilum sp. (in: g-proteobacteria)]